MKCKATILARAGGVAAGLAAGWLASAVWWPAEMKGEARRVPLSQSSGKRSTADFATLVESVNRAGGPGAQIRAALDVAASLAPADYERMLDQLRFMPAHSAGNIFLRAVLRRWIAADPPAALRWCVGHESDLVQESMRLWIGSDAEAAREFLTTLTGRNRENAVRGCAAGLAGTNPGEALAFIARCPGSDDFYFQDAFRDLAKRDPQWLIDNAESLPVRHRESARMEAANEWAKRDFAAAVAWALQQPDQRNLLGGALGATSDRKAALKTLASLPAKMQEEVANSCSYALCRTDPGEVLTLLSRTPGLSEPAMRDLLNRVAGLLGTADPAGAAGRLNALFPSQISNWGPALVLNWDNKDPGAARAWALTLPASEARESMLKRLDESAASQAAQAKTTPAERIRETMRTGAGYVQSGAILDLSAADRTGLLQEASEKLAGNQHNSSASSIRDSMKEYFPSEYARWLTSLPETPANKSDMSSFAKAWSVQEPDVAAAWALTLPAGETQTSVVRAIAWEWRALDSAGARQWVESLPPGAAREQALEALSGKSGEL